MCGIAGMLGVAEELAKAAAPRMLTAMRHRGPDDEGIEVVADPQGRAPPAVLIHTRLAIVDLSSAAHQPMPDKPPDETAPPNWIVFNGEIYNFLAFHDKLASAGWPCRTRCDTEVILHAYRAWGESSVEKLHGMFAWCLLDTQRSTAWFCRDHLGIKPLYLFRPRGGGLLFASELRTLLAAGADLVPPLVNAFALESFLAQGAVYGAESIVQGVHLLAPGQSLTTDWLGRAVKERTYWRIPFTPLAQEGARDLARDQAEHQLGATLRQAVQMQLLADVPLGLFLSGGIDSAALATVATEVAGTDIQTVSIGFDQPQFDETQTAEAVATALGVGFRSVRLTGQDILDHLTDALTAADQPTVDGFNVYFVAQAARRAGLTVALSGLGGDELFGGYASFADVPRALLWRRRTRWARPIGRTFARLMSTTGGRPWAKAAEMFRRQCSPVQMYLLRRELFLPLERRAMHPLPAESDPDAGIPQALLTELLEQSRGLDVVNQVSCFELSSYMRHMLLRDADIFSMAHGLEVRVPLLDHRLVEEAASIAGAHKRPDPRPKPLLLDAVGKRLPALVYTRPKRGFTFPWEAWLRGPLRSYAKKALSDTDVWLGLGFNPAAPARLWKRFEARDRRVAALQILALLILAHYSVRHGLRKIL
ncbi:MAG TPA: asparagine synthase (glutamine-hydrolyzing) [Gemmataceae bacterium]|jgi:asparagine synthase (glutamine-hydrolysing)